MAVIIEAFGDQYMIADLTWMGPKSGMAELFNSEKYPSGGSDPWPDLTFARHIITTYGGKIISQGEPPPYDPKAVY